MMTEKPSYDALLERVQFLEAELARKARREKERCSLIPDKSHYEVLRLMIDNVTDLIWAKDADDRFVFVNQAMADTLLKSSSTDEPLGKTDMFFAERERARGHVHTFGEICVNSDQVVKKTKKPGHFLEHGLVRGENLVLDVRKAPIFNEAGDVSIVVGCGRDVTKEKQLASVLLEGDQRFIELIEDVSGISIQGYDEERRVILWNPASEKIYGYTVEEALGRKLEDLIIPEPMKEEIIQAHKDWIKYGEKIPAGPLVLKNKAGDAVHVHSSHTMRETKSGKQMFCIDVDLSQLKKMEEEKALLQTQLLQAQKMESIGRLAGGIAHDLNNILCPVLGYSEILLADVSDDNPFRESLGEIRSGVLRARDVVRQILTFSRQDSESTPKPIALQPVIQEAMKLMKSIVPPPIEMELDLGECIGAVIGDSTKIHQIVMNLTTNAYHAMEDTGGCMSVRLKKVDASELKQPICPELTSGVYACLSVADTGTGMPPDLIDKIFDPFFTTKERGKGTGMGLSVVHGLVKSMEGSIAVCSELGKGSLISVFLPLVEQPAEPAAEEQKDMEVGAERILLVDDEELVLTIETRMLERMGYQVTAFHDSQDALAAFRQMPNQFDLVITDKAMPVMSGEKLAHELVQIRSDIPILLCTGFGEGQSSGDRLALGISGFLMKPISMADLADKVRCILDKAAARRTMGSRG